MKSQGTMVDGKWVPKKPTPSEAAVYNRVFQGMVRAPRKGPPRQGAVE